MKVILVTDCFVKNKEVESKLLNFLDRFRSNFDICLVSNTILSKEIQSKVNHFIYDSRNQLFSDNFDSIPSLTIFNEFDTFRIETDISGNQPHGLSVLINLFNQLEYCNSLGYTHILRLETDTIFQEDALGLMNGHIKDCLELDKKGFFYKGEAGIICQYFFCEIKYFLDNVHLIKSEQDYKDFLLHKFGNMNFINVESFLYHNLVGKSELEFKEENDLHNEFNKSSWNTEVSESHLDSKYGGCFTSLVRGSNKIIIYSQNFINLPKSRTIDVICSDGSYQIVHNLGGKGHWSFNDVPDNVIRIEVYEDGSLVFSQTIDQISSRFIDKTKKNIYFDIGCNVGDYAETLKSTSSYDKIVCVDANPSVVDIVNQRFLNDPNIEAINKAVSSEKEPVDFYICNGCDVISTCDPSWVSESRFANRHIWDTVIKVETISIDDMIELYGVPNHIKIDVEGYELNVIKSMTKNYGSEIRFEWSEEKISDIIQIVSYLSSIEYTKFSCMFEDRYDGTPTEYKNTQEFISYMVSICDPSRKTLWGMIYCNN